jgi:hypothetical protein
VLDTAAWIAIAAFVGLAAALLKIVWPRRDWEFALHPAYLIRHLEAASGELLSLDRLQRDLTLHLGASVSRNEEGLARMMTAFNIGNVFFAIETVAWVVSVATGG